jgi:hypothetical protein
MLINASRITHASRLVAAALCLAGGLAAGTAHAGEPLEVTLVPGVKASSLLARVYELPPGFSFDGKSCNGAAGIKVIPPNRFEATPYGNADLARGYNLRVNNGIGCVSRQVWLPSAVAPAAERAAAATQGAAAPADDVAMRQDGKPAEPVPALLGNLSKDAWYFLTPRAKDLSAVTVTLPSSPSLVDCSGGAAAPVTTVVFDVREGKKTLKIANCGGQDQALIRVELDALGLGGPSQAPTQFWSNAKQTLQIVSASDRGEIGVRLTADEYAQHAELWDFNTLVEVGRARGKLTGCDATSCLFTFQHPATDPSIALRLDTPATRELFGKGLKLYYANGIAVDESTAGKLDTVSKWELPQARITLPVKPGATTNTPIGVTPELARVLDGLNLPLACSYKDKNGSAQSLARCATFHRDPGSERFTLEKEAIPLIHDNRALSIALDDKSLRFGISVTAPNNTKVNLELQQEACTYDLLQLTAAVAGTKNGEVLYWVRSSAACLNAPLRARVINGGGTVQPVTQWLAPPPSSVRSAPPASSSILKITFTELTAADDARDIQLGVTQGATEDGELAATRDGTSFPLHVERAIESGAVRVDAEVGIGALDDRPVVAENVQAIAIKHRNRIWVPRTVDVPWRVRLASLANDAPATTLPEDLAGAELTRYRDPYVLPRAIVDGRPVYFVEGLSTSDGALTLVTELSAPASRVLSRPRTLPAEALDALKALPPAAGRVYLGAASLTLANRRTRPLWTPFDLKRSASIQCDGEKHEARPGMPSRAYRRGAYRHCQLRIDLPQESVEDVGKDQCKRCGGGDTGVEPSYSGDRSLQQYAREHWGLQQIKVDVDDGDENKAKTAAVVTERDFARVERSYAVVEDGEGDSARCVKKMRAVAVFNLPDLLDQFGDPTDYTNLRVRLSHAPDKELGGRLKDAYVPPAWEDARTETAAIKTIIVPAWTSVFTTRAGTSWGLRYYLAATANLSLYRTRDPGFTATSSSDYAKKLQANIGYGAVMVFDLWNFSSNKALLPYLSPQIDVGVLGPTDFNTKEWWRGFSGVAGLTIRLPAASKPEPGTVEAQTGLIVWGEIGAGARSTPIGSLLVGLNVKLGSLSP